jgi:3-phenylpropionate/trans-cinnamate dioxygenase ferredoxin component
MTATVRLDELADCAPTRVMVDGRPVCVVRIGADVYAIGDVCSHAHVSLSEGEVWCDEREIECPQHSSTFSLESGEPQTLPATRPVPVYAVTIEGDEVTIDVTKEVAP